MKNKKEERFVLRYNNVLIPRINNLLTLEKRFSSKMQELTNEEKKEFCLAIKYAFEYVWKTMKDFLKFNNKTALLPRKIFEEMSTYIDNTEDWISLLNDLYYFFTYRNEVSYKDRLIENYFNKYKNSFDKFLHFISNQEIAIKYIQKEDINYDFPEENHCVLDTYSLYTLINFFINNPKIETVRLHGSRSGTNFRKNTDIDLLVTGSFTDIEFEQISTNAKKLNIPHYIDMCNTSSADTFQRSFAMKNLEYSILLYDKKDFK